MTPKIIWITGGSSGIGFATAKHYLKNNWIVVISSSNNEKLQKAKFKGNYAKALEQAAIDKGSYDNVSVVLLFLK